MSEIREKLLAEWEENPTLETPDELNKRIYEAEIEQLQAEVKKLEERVKFLTEYDADIDGLQAEVKKLKKALTHYDQVIRGLNETNDRLQAEVAAAENRHKTMMELADNRGVAISIAIDALPNHPKLAKKALEHVLKG